MRYLFNGEKENDEKMKQQLKGEELVRGLYEVRSLLIAMNNVNKKELQIREQIKQTIPAKNIKLKKSEKKVNG